MNCCSANDYCWYCWYACWSQQINSGVFFFFAIEEQGRYRQIFSLPNGSYWWHHFLKGIYELAQHFWCICWPNFERILKTSHCLNFRELILWKIIIYHDTLDFSLSAWFCVLIILIIGIHFLPGFIMFKLNKRILILKHINENRSHQLIHHMVQT